MIVAIKIGLLISLVFIAFQDIKDQLIWWFLPIVYGICGGYLFFQNSQENLYPYMLALNTVFLIGVLAVMWLIPIIIKSGTSMRRSFGLGDILMMLAMAMSFSFFQFLLFLVCTLLFSMCVHTFLKKKKEEIPLAGYMSLFLTVVYLGAWICDESILYP